MPRLKNRQENIPLGFQWLQPETGFTAPSGRSFRAVVDSVVAHRLGNPWLLKKHNWQTNWDAVADEIDSYNALRLMQNNKWHHFVDESGGSSFSGPFTWPRESRFVGAVGGSVKKTVAGVKVLLDFLGSGGRAVAKEKAEVRASTCAICPLNKQGDWKTAFTEEAAREILLMVGILNDLKLSTSHDAKLGLCSACGCVNKTKVWVPLQHILKEMKPAIKAQLNQSEPVCWILQEELAAPNP